MSADIELLRLAAKAAGYYLRNEIVNPDDDFIGFRVKARPLPGPWNPFNDDGDALRLSVQLKIELSFINGDTHADGQSEGGPDKLANTRRAIVRAAADIGRAMP